MKELFLSIKENMEMVKEELNSEEKFFEKAVITEKFVKKYKNIMIGSVVAIVVLVGSNIAYGINKQKTIDSANKALVALHKDAKDSSALSELKSLSPSLHDVWVYSQAIADKDLVTLKGLSNSKTLLVSDLVKYELAQDSKDISALNEYALKQDAIYKDLALIQSAVILMNDSKIDAAHQKLALITPQSSLGKVAQALSHYGVK